MVICPNRSVKQTTNMYSENRVVEPGHHSPAAKGQKVEVERVQTFIAVS